MTSQWERYHGPWGGGGGGLGLLFLSGRTSIVSGKFKYAFTLRVALINNFSILKNHWNFIFLFMYPIIYNIFVNYTFVIYTLRG